MVSGATDSWRSTALALALTLVACGDDTVNGGLAQLSDASSTLELGTVTGTPTTVAPDVRDDTTTTPDIDERDSATTATDTTVEPDVVGPCAELDCDDADPCTFDTCDPETGTCDHAPVVCPIIGENPCVEPVCVSDEGGCVDRAIEGACDDGVACTTEDRCQGGECKGDLKSCDDEDPCTTDACVDGGCTFVDIPSCAPDAQCDNQVNGAHCDDGSSSTTADMCLAGKCRGYVATRVQPSIVDAIGLVVSEIDFGPGGWTAAFWGLNSNESQTWALAKVTTASAPVVYEDTEQSAPFTAIHNGWAGDEDGHVWSFASGEWSTDNDFDDAVFWTDRGVITDLWTTIDKDLGGNPSDTRMWIVGNDGVADEYIRYCRPGDMFFEDAVVCEAQELDDFEASSLPKAVAGIGDCSFIGCEGALVATAADAAASGGAYTDTYENPRPGDDEVWTKGATPSSAAQRASRAIAAWGTSAEAQFLAVGTNGYMVHRRGGGSWSAPLQFRADQSRRTFSGVWVGAGVIVLSAHQASATEPGKLDYELWTCPSNKDVEVGSNWTIHLLGTSPSVQAAGLYDVAGRPEGELRAVGAIKKNGDGQLLDGIVYVRAP